MYKRYAIALMLMTAMTGACSIHKIDVQQGNIVTPDMLEQLNPGMTKRQVEFIMGTPLIISSFNSNHWVYYYRLQSGNDKVEQYHVTLDFEDGKLSHIENALPPPAENGAPSHTD